MKSAVLAAALALSGTGVSPRFVVDPALKGLDGSYEIAVSSAGRVELSYREPSGAYYGALRLAELARKGALKPQRLREGPAFRWRGVLEGFYGKPWTWDERRRFVEWMARRRLNLFVIAPKDDDNARKYWRRPWPKAELEALRALKAAADAGFVELAWTLSPGLDLRPDAQADVDAAVEKFEPVLAVGVRRLALAFDDTEADPGQIRFAGRVLDRLVARYPDAEMTFVPAQYWGLAAPSRYLGAVAGRLDGRWRVAWTGDRVLCRMISMREALTFREYLRHRLVLGDNYPVQDRLVDSGRLFLGPLTGRAGGLPAYHDVYVANASPLMEASKLPLATAAAYAWDPRGYDPQRAWREAASSVGGKAAPWLALLAQNCAGSWLTGPGTPPPGKLQGLIDGYWAGDGRGKFLSYLRELEALPDRLESGLGKGSSLALQLSPWSRRLAAEARAARLASEALERQARGGHSSKPQAWDLGSLDWDLARDPAVVADGALERFLQRGMALLTGGLPADPRPAADRLRDYVEGRPGAGLSLAASLDALAAAPRVVEAEAGGRAARIGELDPWIDALALAAARARASMDPPLARRPWVSWPGTLADRRARWRRRALFLPLAASRAVIEDFLARSERLSDETAAPPRGLSWPLKAWLVWRRWRRPGSLPVVLERQTRDCLAKAEECGPLASTFKSVESLGTDLPIGARLPEARPWVQRAQGYAAMGLKALSRRGRDLSKRPLTVQERDDWAKGRQRLRSGNGLEMAVELDRALGAFVRWSRRPPGRRSKTLDLELPADPADLL